MNTRYPKVRTAVPGPRAQELLKIKEKYVPNGVSVNVPTFIEKGQGALIEDVDGNIFLDFAGGIGVMNIGYSHPEVLEAVKNQVDKFFHSSFNVILYESYIRLAEKLAEITPGKFSKKTLLLNSGAEAVENAVKIARKYTKRTDIISFEGAFHGRTLMGMSLTSKIKPYKHGFGPFAPGIHKIPYPYCYRCPYSLKKSHCNLWCAERLNEIFMSVVDPETVAALIMEPIQGEGGFIVPPDEFVKRIRDICKQNNILFIMDEIQTGFYRTGKLFASEYLGIEPDIITTAKSLAAGIPLSAVTARAEILEASHVGGIGGTYCGNPLGCSAALKVIEVMQRDNFAQKSQSIGRICTDRLKALQRKYKLIGDVRGKGAMVAIELVKNRYTKEPAKEETQALLKKAYSRGLILLSAGLLGNVVRILVPLVISEDQLNAGLDIIEDIIKELDGSAL